jgi:hypothetical protein
MGQAMKIFNNFEDMLADEPPERRHEVITYMLRNLTHYYESEFVQQPFELQDDEAMQIAELINELHFEREELIGLLLRFAVDLLEDNEDATIQ